MRKKSVLLSAITALAVGVGSLMLANALPASAAAAAIFKITCAYSHSNADDMIVFPGQPGASHVHDYFGNAATKGTSSYDSLKGVQSTCPNNDHAAYWVPALYRDGKKIQPDHMTTYYSTPVDPAVTRIEAFPPGFEMIAGNSRNVNPDAMGREYWGCGDDSQISHRVPARCSDGVIQVRITFPSCWNGVRSTGNATANLAFPSRGTCPKGFNHPLPTVRVNVNYKVGTPVGTITLSSGNSSSAHADFVNVWDQATLEGLVQKCLNEKQGCTHFFGTSPGRAG